MDVEGRRSPFDVASDRCGQLDVHLSTDGDSDGESQLLLLPCLQNAPRYLPLWNSELHIYT